MLFSLPRANSLVGGPIEIEPGTPEQVSASEDAGGGRVPLFLTSFPSFHVCGMVQRQRFAPIIMMDNPTYCIQSIEKIFNYRPRCSKES